MQRISRAALWVQRLDVQQASWQEVLAAISKRHRDQPPWLQRPAETQWHWFCYDCDMSFTSRRGLLMHRTRAHGRVKDIALRVRGAVCQRCGWDFHAIPRLIKHLETTTADCYAAYLQHVPPMEADEYAKQAAEDAAERRRRRQQGLRDLHADAPAMAVAPPALPDPTDHPVAVEGPRCKPTLVELKE